MTDPDANRTPAVTDCKVGRLIETYDLDGIGDELVAKWTDESGDRRSLRELASYFNHELLRNEMRRTGMGILGGEVENLYRLLTDDDTSGGMRAQVRSRLANNGIDVDQLTESFVSHRAVHTYLTRYRDVDYGTEAESPSMQHGVRTIRRLQQRLVTVTTDIVDRTRKSHDISLGEFDVLVDVRILCHDCGATREVTTLLTGSGCDCR